MGLSGFIIDTNILIYYFSGALNQGIAEYVSKAIKVHFGVSVISEIEFLGWQGFQSTPDDYAQARIFLKDALLYPLTPEIAQRAIAIRQNYKIKTPDAVIAATALEHDLTLLSRNEKDFAALPELIYVNPFA